MNYLTISNRYCKFQRVVFGKLKSRLKQKTGWTSICIKASTSFLEDDQYRSILMEIWRILNARYMTIYMLEPSHWICIYTYIYIWSPPPDLPIHTPQITNMYFKSGKATTPFCPEYSSTLMYFDDFDVF